MTVDWFKRLSSKLAADRGERCKAITPRFEGLSLQKHFKGLTISVIGCSGTSDKAPPVNLNVIDFEDVGTLTGIDGNSFPGEGSTETGGRFGPPVFIAIAGSPTEAQFVTYTR